MGPRTSYFFAEPTFLEGVALLADFGGVLASYNWGPDSATANRWALQQDWAAVVDDFWAASRQSADQLS